MDELRVWMARFWARLHDRARGAPMNGTLWEQCLQELSLHHPALPVHLAGSTARISAGRVTVHVLTPQACAWLDTAFRPTVEGVIRQIAGRDLQVTFTL